MQSALLFVTMHSLLSSTWPNFALQTSQLEDGLRQLYVLEAIDADGKITELGKEIARLPVDPSIARALLAAKTLG